MVPPTVPTLASHAHGQNARMTPLTGDDSTTFPIALPSAEGIAEAHALCQRWLPAFLDGRRADDDVYAEGVVTWHNTTEKESVIQQKPSRTRANDSGAQLQVVDVMVNVFDGGWVFRGTTVGTNEHGGSVRIPVCLIAHVVDGKIARFSEYADSRAFETLFSTPEVAARPAD